MRGETVYKQAFNAMIDDFAAKKKNSPLPTETALARQFGASRTNVRKAIAEMRDRKLIKNVEGSGWLPGVPRKSEHFPLTKPLRPRRGSKRNLWSGCCAATANLATAINGLELARQFEVSTSAVREYLNGFRRFGLIERRPNSSWIIRGFTREFALEIFEVRDLFETRSAMAFASQPQSSPIWEQVEGAGGRTSLFAAPHRRGLSRLLRS